LLRGNAKDRAEYYKSLFNVGALSQNDISKLENQDPIPGGDEYYVPMNMIPASKVNEYFTKQMEKPGKQEGTGGNQGEKSNDKQ
jgi:hypothetical protein